MKFLLGSDSIWSSIIITGRLRINHERSPFSVSLKTRPGVASKNMNQPHIIRLRGPWQRTVVSGSLPVLAENETPEPAATSKQSARVQMPSDWRDDLGVDFIGVVCYTRMFNRPTSIDASTDIRLRLHRFVGKRTEIRLNGETLADVRWPEDSVEIDVAGKLQPRNCLEVEIDSLLEKDVAPEPNSPPPPAAGLVGEVHLEIR